MIKKISEILNYKEKIYFFYLLCLMVVGMILETLGIGLVIPIILILLKGKEGLLEISFFQKYEEIILNYNSSEIVVIGLLLLLSVYLFKYLFLVFLYFRQFNFSANVLLRITNQIFKNYLIKPYKFFLDANSSKLINNLITQVSVFTDQALETLMTIGTELFILIGILSFLIYVEPSATLLIISMITIPSLIFFLIVKNKAKKWGQTKQLYEEQNIKNLQQTLSGIKEIKIFGKEIQFYNIFKNNLFFVANTRKKMLILNQIPRVWLESLAILSISALIYFLSNQKGSEILISTIGLFAAAAFRLLPSLNRIMLAAQVLRYGYAATNRVHQELEILKSKNIIISDKFEELPEQFKSINFSNVNFGYNTNQKILNNINLKICKGDFIGVAGVTGSGKSTFVDILTGLIEPVSGQVLYNEKLDIIDFEKSWQSKIGYAPQMYNLLDDTILNNITFNDKEIEKKLIILKESLKIAELEKFIETLPDKLNTKIGERGIKLSGGQKQRIIIARALYRNPEILILDEATNALDSDTEQKIIKNLLMKKKNISIIMITHRESSLLACNKIFRLQKDKNIILEEK
jgi:ABC-type multidrug transport system fused ATPase/permease subunit